MINDSDILSRTREEAGTVVSGRKVSPPLIVHPALSPEVKPVARNIPAVTISEPEVAVWAQRLRRRLRTTCLEAIGELAAAAEARDPDARSHSQNVACYAELLGRRLKLDPELIVSIRAAGLMHDVGKIRVPADILTKPGPLTPFEFEVVKRHPATAVEILDEFAPLQAELPMILHHHERYDGAGYPDGLKGTEIPLGARIIAVADTIEVMLSCRSYKEPCDRARVREELREGAGGQFDPEVAATAVQWLGEVQALDNLTGR